MTPDLMAAHSFLSILDEGADAFCFRVFDDDEDRKDRTLAGKFYGDFTKVAHPLTAANERGCGVFVVVNDGGQDAASIKRVRAVFADLDGAPLEPILSCGLEPHAIVESSPGKFHAYWLVDGLSLEQFEGVQRAIAAEFSSDPSVIDLPRVMRLPGFWHKKGNPFQSKLIHESGARPYAADVIVERWPPDAIKPKHDAQPALGQVVDINRHASILKETRFLAHDVQQGHMTRDEALNVMRDRVATGRYSRHVPDDEIVRALDGALRKMPGVAASDRPAAGFTWGDDMTSAANLKPSQWVIRKVLPLECTGLLYGGWGTCKTFLAIDWAGCIANGMDWHGRPTKQGTVFYLAGEGEGGFARRMRAWELAYGGSMSRIAFREMPDIRNAAALEDLVAAVAAMAEERGDPRLIVIDTLFTALNGGDENGGKDMGEVFQAMRSLRQQFNCAVLAIHHTGHDGDRARGHSSMPAGVDVQFFLKAKEGGSGVLLELSNPKQKDGKKYPKTYLTTESVPLVGLVDDDGEVETSLVIRAPAQDLMQAMHGSKDDELDGLKAEARRLKDKGMTLLQIGEMIGRDKGTISRWLKEAA